MIAKQKEVENYCEETTSDPLIFEIFFLNNILDWPTCDENIISIHCRIYADYAKTFNSYCVPDDVIILEESTTTKTLKI